MLMKNKKQHHYNNQHIIVSAPIRPSNANIFFTSFITFLLSTTPIINGFPSYAKQKIKSAQYIGSKSNILYRKSILPPKEFDLIKKDLLKASDKLKLPLQNEHKSSIAKLRKGVRLSNDSKTVEILSNPNGAVAQLINRHFCDDDCDMVFKQDIPVEVNTFLCDLMFSKMNCFVSYES